MLRNLTSVSLCTFLAIMGLTDCMKDDSDGSGSGGDVRSGADRDIKIQTPTQARTHIKDSLRDINGCAVQFRDGAALQMIIDLLELRDGEAQREDWAETVLDELYEAMDLDSVEDDDAFHFNARTGTYDWGLNTFRVTSTPSDAIVVTFPATRGSSTNNASISLNAYEHTQGHIDGDSYMLPSKVAFAATVDGKEIAGVAADADYDGGDIAVPIDLDATLKWAPFTLQAGLDRSKSTEFHVTATLAGPAGCNANLEATAVLFHADYENLEEDDIDRITGTVSLPDNLTLEASIDFDALEGLDDPTAAQVNRHIDVKLLHKGSKIAEIVADAIHSHGSDEEDRVVFTFSDGTKDDVVDYLDPFAERVEDDFKRYFGD